MQFGIQNLWMRLDSIIWKFEPGIGAKSERLVLNPRFNGELLSEFSNKLGAPCVKRYRVIQLRANTLTAIQRNGFIQKRGVP